MKRSMAALASPAELAKAMAAGAVTVDLRGADERTSQCLPHALWREFDREAGTLNGDRPSDLSTPIILH